MKKLPVIVGMGGMNAAGRTSGHHAYKRTVCDALFDHDMASTWQDLANRMGVPATDIDAIKAGTLVRRIERFDPSNVAWQQPTKLMVSSAGGLPRGFDPASLYNSHHHPRALQLSIFGASDALSSMGLNWDTLLTHIKPDEVAVFAGSALAQLDECSLAGVFGSPLRGVRINSKMMPLSLPEMPADFINSYVINSVGTTGHNVGACATFLYNVKLGLEVIQSGKARIAIVGGVEAPIVPEVVEGFRVMGALTTDDELCAMDGSATPNNRRACRPFSTNAGFTIAEASQFIILMDDALAVELGAHVYGSVADVFVHADANKKSIASPGIGNYITMAKAGALAKAMLGDLSHTYVQAHGTGTPQNRVTESHIINEVAKTFGHDAWPVAAVKSYVGHTVSAAAGDQLMSALGAWQYGTVPGIKTIDHIADDVHDSHLNILMDHLDIDETMQGVVVNSKGFGGNNASSLVLSPGKTLDILKARYSTDEITAYQKKLEATEEQIKLNDNEACAGKGKLEYHFGEAVMDAEDVSMTESSVKLSGFAQAIDLPSEDPFA